MSTAPAAPLVQTFMTHRMSDASIEMLATGREVETQRIMDAVERSLKAAPGALQHMVIYGPRGFGKSFIARLVQIETGKLAAARSLPVPFVLLPEEQHNLTRNPHALPAYIAHRLADLRSGGDRSWAGAMFQWPEPKKEAQQWDEATAALEAELDLSLPAGKGMAIVVIENFDFLLFSVFKEAATEQRLRKWLDRRSNRLMLIATATGSVDMDYERPLFQAFQSIRLEPWEQESCIAYFNRRRQAEGKAALDAAMEAKARAVADFIGGNPRLAQLLAEVLETQDALTVADTMKALADKLSDYYRRRIDDLPPLVQGLLDALIRGGEPASQTELAERVGAPAQSTIARVMQDLQRSDIIRGLPAPDSRETLYRVTDRVFVHFYRLRQGNQLALQTPLATILEFLRAFYSRDEQRTQPINHLDARRHAEARLFADLAQEGQASAAISNGYFLEFGTRLQRYLDATGEVLPVPLAELLQEMEDCPERLVGRVDVWTSPSAVFQAVVAVLAAQALARLGLVEKADERFVRQLATNADPVAEVLLHHDRCSLFIERRDMPAAIHEAAAAGELCEAQLPVLLQALAYKDRAWELGNAGSHQDALASARKAVALAALAGDLGEQANAMGLASHSLNRLGRYREALAEALDGIDLAYSVADEWCIAAMAIAALRAAVSCPSPQAVAAFARWVAWALERPRDERESSWELWLGEGLAAAIRARAWEAWDTLIEGQGGRMQGSHLSTSEVGRAIALRGESDGRAEGFEAARAALPRLVRLWDVTLATESTRDSQLGELVAGLAEQCRDPGLLRDVAALLTADISPQAPVLASLLIALAQVDEADDPQAALARMEPDTALWLRRIRQLSEPPAKPRRRRK